MQLTKAFVLAVEAGASALEAESESLAQTDELQQDNAVGRCLRSAVEEKRQTADLLNGWAARARKEAGMPPRDQ